MAIAQGSVAVSDQHAYSLYQLVGWFQRMINVGYIPEDMDRSNALTAEYCDELMEELGNG